MENKRQDSNSVKGEGHRDKEDLMKDMWQKTLAYFGLGDEDHYEEEDYEEFNEDRLYTDTSSTVRKIDRSSDHSRSDRVAALRPVSAPQIRVHIVAPKNFNDAQRIADKFKSAVPVILNLQECDVELAKKLIDFGSGLTYALDGGMQKVADKVFLLTPTNVTVSAEEKRRLRDRGLIFEQV